MFEWTGYEGYGRMTAMDDRWRLMFSEHERSPTYSARHYIRYLKKYVSETTPDKAEETSIDKASQRVKDGSNLNKRNPEKISPLSYFLRKMKLDLKLCYDSFAAEFIKPPNHGLRLLIQLLKNLQQNSSSKPFNSLPRHSSIGTFRLEEYKKNMVDEQDCLLCIKYSLRAPILTFILTGPTAVDKILDAFTMLRIKYSESTRFRMLISMMHTRGLSNVLFQVSCLRLLNSLLRMCRSANMRVFLQFELEEAGLDWTCVEESSQGDGLEYDDLRKEIKEWRTRYLDVDSLLKKFKTNLRSEFTSPAAAEYHYDQHFGSKNRFYDDTVMTQFYSNQIPKENEVYTKETAQILGNNSLPTEQKNSQIKSRSTGKQVKGITGFNTWKQHLDSKQQSMYHSQPELRFFQETKSVYVPKDVESTRLTSKSINHRITSVNHRHLHPDLNVISKNSETLLRKQGSTTSSFRDHPFYDVISEGPSTPQKQNKTNRTGNEVETTNNQLISKLKTQDDLQKIGNNDSDSKPFFSPPKSTNNWILGQPNVLTPKLSTFVEKPVNGRTCHITERVSQTTKQNDRYDSGVSVNFHEESEGNGYPYSKSSSEKSTGKNARLNEAKNLNYQTEINKNVSSGQISNKTKDTKNNVTELNASLSKPVCLQGQMKTYFDKTGIQSFTDNVETPADQTEIDVTRRESIYRSLLVPDTQFNRVRTPSPDYFDPTESHIGHPLKTSTQRGIQSLKSNKTMYSNKIPIGKKSDNETSGVFRETFGKSQCQDKTKFIIDLPNKSQRIDQVGIPTNIENTSQTIKLKRHTGKNVSVTKESNTQSLHFYKDKEISPTIHAQRNVSPVDEYRPSSLHLITSNLAEPSAPQTFDPQYDHQQDSHLLNEHNKLKIDFETNNESYKTRKHKTADTSSKKDTKENKNSNYLKIRETLNVESCDSEGSIRSYSQEIGRVLSELDKELDLHDRKGSFRARSTTPLVAYV